MEPNTEKENLLNCGFKPKSENFNGTILLKHGNKYIGYIYEGDAVFATEWNLEGKCIDCSVTIGSISIVKYDLEKLWYKNIPERGLLCYIVIDGHTTDTIVHVKSYHKGFVRIASPRLKGAQSEIYRIEDQMVSVDSLLVINADFNRDK